MFRSRRSKKGTDWSVVMSALVMLLMMSVGIGVANGEPEAEQQGDWLRVELRAVKTHFVVGEPIWLVLAVANPDRRSHRVVRSSTPGSDYLNYEVLDPGSNRRTFLPLTMLSGIGMRPRELALSPGDSFSRADNLTYDRRGLLASKPGEYIIHAVYSIPDGVTGRPQSIRSNGVGIVVEVPQGIDKDAYDALTAATKKCKLASLWAADTSLIESYEAIIAKYPASVFVPYVHFYLGESYGIRMDYTKDREEITSALRKAIDHYRTAADLLPCTPLGAYASQLAGRTYAMLSDVVHAEEMWRNAFTSCGAMTEKQCEILMWLKHLETGMFRNSSGLAKPGEDVGAKVLVPLRPYAEALGYSLSMDAASGRQVVRKGEYRWTVNIGDDPLPVCGKLYKDMHVKADKDGELLVSPQVIAMLMVERYGKDMARQMAFLLTLAQ